MPDILIPASLSEEKEKQLSSYLEKRIYEIRQSLNALFRDKVTKWNAAYEARPAEEQRQFPFQNASNLIIPIIAIHTDTLHAQLMAAIFKTKPIVATKIFGAPNKGLDLFKEAYQEFMDYITLEPEELDLYRVYNESFKGCIKNGTVTFKVPWEKIIRDFYVPGGDGTGAITDFIPETVFEGPRPEKIPFTGFYFPTSAKSIEEMDFKAHKKVMTRYELEERGFRGVYDKKKLEAVLKSPDRTTPEEHVKEQQSKVGIEQQPSDFNQEWDIYECHLRYHFEGESVSPRMIVTFHENSKTVLRVMYDNFRMDWFVGARLLARDDLYPGYGYAETLFQFQEGASETYNGFRDNQTVANTRVWRVNPDSKLNEGYRIYPSAKLPAEKDEIEPLAHGDLNPINIDDLRLLLDLAERRSGVSPPQQGYGAGTMQGRKGVYSAMGTLALIQEGNSRKDLTISDMRDAHTRLMRLVTRLYGEFGIDSKFHKDKRLAKFGEKGQIIAAAIRAIISGQIALPVYASTASVNREVEKQNDLMLTQVMDRHYGMISQLLGSIQGPMTPPNVKEYLTAVIHASNTLMRTLLRNFGHDDVDILVPEPKEAPSAVPGAPQQGGGQNPQLAGRPGMPGVQ
jgi:hypothetical protein